MVDTNQIFISFDREQYQKNKSNNLEIQEDTLKILKHINQLKQIKKQEVELKFQLQKLLPQLEENLAQLESQFPSPAIPRSVQNQLHHKEEIPPIYQEPEIDPNDQTLDKELQEVQDKLKQMNS